MIDLLILGSTGMLGNAVTKHFSELEGFKVHVTHRGDMTLKKDSIYFDASQPDFDTLPSVDYVINCIGTIKPFMSSNMPKSIQINAVFPYELAKYYSDKKTKVIHITTDCVFSGDDGNYSEESFHDCRDNYGKSKSLGEPTECMVLRTSIIGREIHKNASLVSWAISQKNKKVNGFTNHFWNGITTNQYAKCCQQIIENNLYETGTRHLFSNSVSKYELLETISNNLKLDLEISAFEAPQSCDRTLGTVHELCAELKIPTIKKQIEEMR
tara:strand:+ start:1212 stop:2018 length:807 start_codon:yes stop_codon:yes gene_type:complete